MNKTKIAMAVMVAVLALSMSAVAFAQTPTPPNPPKTTTPSPYAKAFWETLAKNLDVTVEKLQTAIRDALKSTVTKMLNDGKLTQEQADWMKQHGAGQMAGGQMGYGRGMRGNGQGRFANPDCPYYNQTAP